MAIREAFGAWANGTYTTCDAQQGGLSLVLCMGIMTSSGWTGSKLRCASCDWVKKDQLEKAAVIYNYYRFIKDKIALLLRFIQSKHDTSGVDIRLNYYQ
jgi:hypothetical protein